MQIVAHILKITHQTIYGYLMNIMACCTFHRTESSNHINDDEFLHTESILSLNNQNTPLNQT